LAVLAAGAAIYAAGSVLMVRPYVSRPAMLFVPEATCPGRLRAGASPGLPVIRRFERLT